ncbi:MAG: MT-A70 family methyltransferase [Candidatus Brocadia sinica]|nr:MULTISPECIES: MT-A70 family methyltransferase [Brocadia]MCK6466874.1 MT-A70 family methyltransferase [Candidatus Brocadia sinica]
MQKIINITQPTAAQDSMSKACGLYSTILADPPWRFENRTGKMAPEHQRLLRYPTMTIEEICEIPVSQVAAANSHLYLWVPNALLAEGLEAMKRWGFTYKTNIVWYKIRKDGGPDGRGGWILFSKCYRTRLVWCSRAYENASTGADSGKHHLIPEEGAFTKTKSDLRSYRKLLARSLPGVVRQIQAGGMGSVRKRRCGGKQFTWSCPKKRPYCSPDEIVRTTSSI